MFLEVLFSRAAVYTTIASIHKDTWADSRSQKKDATNLSTFNLSNTSYAAESVLSREKHPDNKNDNARNISRLDTATSLDEIPLVCVFPKVNPFEPSVVKIAGLNKETIRCGGSFLPDVTYISGSQLMVNMSKIYEYIGLDEFQHCKYRHISRHQTNDNDFRYSEWSESFTNKTVLPAFSEFLRVECMNNKSELISKSYYCLIPRKDEFDEMDTLNFMKRHVESAPKETLNIIMVGFDSLSRNQFLRGFGETHSYLMNTLKSFDLTMHTQLGSNTFPNFLTLFTGHSEEETNRWWKISNHLDTIDMIWHTFQKAGYRTLFTEDGPVGGAFHYLRKGFVYPFARYNNRPLALAMEADKEIWKHDRFCAGNQLEVNFQLDYVGRFLDTFLDKPVFSVAMMSKVTHDDVTNAKILDEHTLNFYKSLSEKGHLNRTLLISFSDHGPRWGPIRDSVNGFFESRTPYTILTFPDWFLRKHPEAAYNLKVNTKRLTTHFDTHATLLDLLYFKSDTPPPVAPLRHGLSLFDKIPWDRTCKDVPIPTEFCTCGYKGIEGINVSSELSEKLSRLVLQSLNSKADTTLCAALKVRQIMRIVKIELNEEVSNKNNGKVVYKVKLQTTPGDGIYESNVYVENSTFWKVGHEIDRLNLYRGQTSCIHNPKQEPYCYCKHLT